MMDDSIPVAAEVAKVAGLRVKLGELGPRPDALQVEDARKAILQIDACLKDQLNDTVVSLQDDKVKALEESAAQAKLPYESLIELDELHQLYEEEEHQAELALEDVEVPSYKAADPEEEVDTYVSSKLQDASEKKHDCLDLSGQFLVHIPESFGKITSLVSLNLSNNCLESIPDSIAGLVNLELLDLQHNQLKVLPDSIGLLGNLKSLDVSGNVLRVLPASIGRCSALIEFVANFNQLELWPSDLGYQLINLQTLCLHLNKLTGLPASIGELRSLGVLDVHFNKLRGLPATIGNLTNLTVLDVSSNFNDFVALPDSIGDLVSLTELDLSFNQIHELPISIGRLSNLKNMKLDENPLVVPPLEVVQEGHEVVMSHMAMLWSESLKTAEEKNLSRSTSSAGADGPQHNASAEGWLPAWAGGTLVSSWFGKVQTGGVASLLGVGSGLSPGSPHAKTSRIEDDSYLEQML